MCDQKESAGFATQGPSVGAYGSGGAAGYAPPNKPGPDPMHISVGELLLSWRRFRDEKRFLEIEVSRLKLRVAELEHERAILS